MKIPEHSAFILIDVEVTGSPINAADEGNNDKVNKYHDSVLKALYFFRLQKDVPIIHVIEKHRDDLSDIGRELDGAEYVHDLESNTDFWAPSAPAGGEYTVVKRRYSAFFGTDLELLFRGAGAEHLFMCGAMTDICVNYTAAEAHQRDYHIHVISDACYTSSDDGVAEAALDNIRYFQKGDVICCSELDK